MPLTRGTSTAVESASAELSVEAVYRRHASDVARWVARLGGPGFGADAAEDVVQEVFMLVQRHLGSYRGDAKLTTWLYRITENAVRHHRRRERWRRRLVRAPQEALLSARSPAALADEGVEQRQAQALIYRALDGMNERYRTALILFEIEDLPGEEVAELLDIKVSNLWVLLHRARADLVRRVTALRERGQ